MRQLCNRHLFKHLPRIDLMQTASERHGTKADRPCFYIQLAIQPLDRCRGEQSPDCLTTSSRP